VYKNEYVHRNIVNAKYRVERKKEKKTMPPLGLFNFISDYLPYFEKINIFFNIIAKNV
jgi:hypothetical protein